MNHLDLFSGIGGFAVAVDTIWPNSNHIFVDNDLFCQAVLREHWPQSKVYGDIRTIANSDSSQPGGERKEVSEAKGIPGVDWQTLCAGGIGGTCADVGASTGVDLLTGGFPCQPFSQAGQRRGTADDRYLWGEMFRVIQATKPAWVIGENVSGLVTWNEGLVLEQVCLDLESQGYEVQPFIIPALSVNAPHRRDRVWIIGYSQDSQCFGWRGGSHGDKTGDIRSLQAEGCDSQCDRWEEDWIEVAGRLCRVDDGVRNRVDRLKTLGNAIVPQVAQKIMRAIREC